ncbi:Guanine nucleotide exchange factor lte1 [Monascus purpureus]|uniref:Guanine nucleotide exchange factor lte1 n=1 Tax=Monascus purpureus TaxID=5098 RepID=A0A507QRU5_MONPU|nr:Guanine nucleotide exchange factor lte1 [Monascus purpureus]BDD57102.1 hypothetical protein MAP00_002496 [Monascus purpureus]
MDFRPTTPHHAPTMSDPVNSGLFRIQDERNIDPNTRDGAEAGYVMSNLRRAHTVAQDRNVSKRKVGARRTRQQLAGALLRAKDSHDLLQRRSLKRYNTNGTPRDAFAAAREAKNFTVGKVGHNGRMYLRPVVSVSPKDPGSPPVVSPLSGQRKDEQLSQKPCEPIEDGSMSSSSSQFSESLRRLEVEESCDDNESVTSNSTRSGRVHSRLLKARSYATIPERRPTSHLKHREELRIVINRPEDRPKTADGNIPLFLEVPIPHHRLGTIEFNSEGDTVLHDSVYTRTSGSDNPMLSTPLGENSVSRPSVSLRVNASSSLLPDRPSFIESMFSGVAALDPNRGSSGTPKPVFYKMNEPVVPSIFDSLLRGMNEPSVVRYIPGTKNISAATPARIVAEISSDSFMDYELVSDFFLTFRSYLSPSDLLSLLLARLQWAINRLQSDGRIIRIRTFAAIRHWILNYFVDDFVPNYDLQVQFCDAINSMYDDVKNREDMNTSDLKILLDLKRCWHGRCAVYWDIPNAFLYDDPDTAIIPGGPVDGQADDNDIDGMHHESFVYPDIPTTAPSFLPTVPGNDETGEHFRKPSSATARSIPISISSDQSIHAASCSLPPKSARRWSGLNRGRAPHLVPLVPPRFTSGTKDHPPCSPVTPRSRPTYGHAHKRSGSFSDSARVDWVPQDQQYLASALELPNLGSLIRGDLYPPAESYATLMAPPSPSVPVDAATGRQRDSNENSKPASFSSLGVKTIIGSIRRVLQSKNGGQNPESRGGSASLRPSMRGKTSALPANLAFGSRLYRDRKASLPSQKGVKIDILCDQVLRQYRLAVAGQRDGENTWPNAGVNTQFRLSLFEPERDVGLATQVSGFRQPRLDSRLTAGSESILIMDDTGMGAPYMSGAHAAPGPKNETNSSRGVSLGLGVSIRPEDSRTSFPIYYDNTPPRQLVPALSEPDSTVQRRSYSVGWRSGFRKSVSPSVRLRKYASFQSGVSKQQRHTLHSEIVSSEVERVDPGQEDPGKPFSRMLRRRPGGDLRRMRDNGSYNSGVSHRSFTTTTTQSRHGSMSEASIHPTPNRFSLIETGSSQNMRPSFEEAIAQFAQIPDDEDGGIESTLLKLEGKWKRQSDDHSGNTRDPENDDLQSHVNGNERLWEQRQSFHSGHRFYGRSTYSSWDDGSVRRETVVGNHGVYSQIGGMLAPPRPYSESIMGSEDSYCPIPLLERGLSDDSMKKPNFSRLFSNAPAMSPPRQSEDMHRGASELESPHASFDLVRVTDSLKAIPRGSTFPSNPSGNSKRSSDASVDVIDPCEAVGEGRSTADLSLSELNFEIPSHPLAHPPSPPLTIQNSTTPRNTTLNPVAFQAPPLTPDPSPHYGGKQEGDDERSRDIQHVSSDVLMRSETDNGQRYFLAAPEVEHVPFVLACESTVLAQQLTLVEMAALSEIDWRDLVDLKWSSGTPCTSSWVQFLSEERRGIDLVVGRFNLMVKWVQSQVVLTEDIDERARTIVKFIHTAAHARSICNYATTLQICIALSSTDCSRLQKTWALVPAKDKRLLRDMEALIQPVRNFHDLRVEMETANLQEGCIPFVGLYVHDLTYNAQKPVQIATTRDAEPLVNFERYRRTARIVKSLLRLIDASNKYNFEPVPGIIERCLWIASLSDAEIRARSKKLA